MAANQEDSDSDGWVIHTPLGIRLRQHPSTAHFELHHWLHSAVSTINQATKGLNHARSSDSRITAMELDEDAPILRFSVKPADQYRRTCPHTSTL